MFSHWQPVYFEEIVT